MALTKTEIKAQYPLPVYNYQVTLGDTTVAFSEVSGLQMQREPITYRQGFSFLAGPQLIRGFVSTVTVTMKRGISKGKQGLYQWMREGDTKDIVIDLCDEEGVSVVRWKVIGALPTKLDAPSFTANSNEVAIESMELIAQEVQLDYL